MTGSGALGLVETKGLVGALEAADAMLKAANVRIEGYRTLRNGAGVGAGPRRRRRGAGRLGELYADHVIARPHGETETVVEQAVIAPR